MRKYLKLMVVTLLMSTTCQATSYSVPNGALKK